MIERSDGRRADELRPVEIIRDYLPHAEGSALIKQGNTWVVCTASVDEKVPNFLKGTARGWVTAEYGMLPRSTITRTPRESGIGKMGGRTQEIQRMIGRSLRAVLSLEALPELTVWIDCDVLRADGGTRMAAVTASFVALYDCLEGLVKSEVIPRLPIRDFVAGVSVGIVAGVPVLDLGYEEDVGADVDMNVVMTGAGRIVEVQGTAEKNPFGRDLLSAVLDEAERGIARLIEIQKMTIGRESFEDAPA